MNSETLIDLLDQHHDHLRRRGAQAERRGLSAPAIALFTLVTLLWELLRPVSPAPAFRASLGRQLVAEAQRQRTQKAIGIQAARAPARGLGIGPAAALGAVSLATAVGAYAFWRRARQQEVQKPALAA